MFQCEKIGEDLEKVPLSISIVVPVYKPTENEVRASNSVISAAYMINAVSEVVFVNDSNESLPQELTTVVADSRLAKVVSNNKNMGRSQAINTGVSHASGDYIWVLDADCWPDAGAVDLINSNFWHKFDIVIGDVLSTKKHFFWDKYQQVRRGKNKTRSTANMLIKRDLFLSVGGFDSSYKWYGFEDQDFFQKIPHDCQLHYSANFLVEHFGSITLDEVRAKMYSAAFSGYLFDQKYPKQYQNMHFFKVDYRYSHLVKRVAMSIMSFFVDNSYSLSKYLIEVGWVPFFLKSYVVLAVSAVAYYKGSKDSANYFSKFKD